LQNYHAPHEKQLILILNILSCRPSLGHSEQSAISALTSPTPAR
jgi:hypothetical protein